MEQVVLEAMVQSQREFFGKGYTLPVKFRIEALKKLYNAIKSREDKIAEALKSDLGKGSYEGYMCEIGLALSEISYMIKHAASFAKKRRVKTPLAQFASSSYQLPSPYGNVLIMSPWNYPFLLTIDPLANAIAAGNTAMVKPSAYSPATGLVIKELLEDIFPSEFVGVVTGGRKENAGLLHCKFDFIFFTGSLAVGKEVMRCASENLTPVILELGGKSPCIVEKSAKIELAAKRIAFGKFLNCGQTCVAPDYVLCHESVKEELVGQLIKQIKAQFGSNAFENQNYGKIINEKHFNRVNGLIDPLKVAFGGKSRAQTMQIEPTVLDNVTLEDPVMQEEIFGPVLPILTYKEESEIYEVIGKVNGGAKPLALYVFTENKRFASVVTERVRYGGGCINDTIIHLATSELGFGGVGESGMGAYHGKIGFDAFSHLKSIVDKKTWIDLPMRYQPYTKGNERLIRRFLK